jgi:acetoin utilization protein AcuC
VDIVPCRAANRYRRGVADVPLLVYGPRSPRYDFGPSHPLTPRRFGPGIDLLRALGAEPGLAPEPASDDELLLCHTAKYLAAVKRFSTGDADPWSASEAGIGPGDDPPFPGMHEAAAAVAGGSLRAIEAILRGDVDHAFHPGGGLHHAMPGRASGFCIYDDPAIAIARARQVGRRVLYVDLDVHHGDGVEAIHAADPGVLTVSFHESGRYLFPGTGSVEVGEGTAAGSVVNVPLEPETGEAAWIAAVSTIVPELAASFGPDIIVSQHGCDTHAWDPLAHLLVTTTAMGRAARLVDALAHRWSSGRWLATGGGGYGVYRVVPRAWAHVWLAGAHREPPDRLPDAWRERWAAESARYGDPSLPETLDDAPNAGIAAGGSQAAAEARSSEMAELARRLAVPRLIREAVDGGWWSPLDRLAGDAAEAPAAPGGSRGGVTIVDRPDGATLDRLTFAPRLVAALDSGSLRTIVARGRLDLTLAVDGSLVVALVASAELASARASDESPLRTILAVGVTPQARRGGLATELLERHLASSEPQTAWVATITGAERDPVDPLDRSIRAGIARRLLERNGFDVRAADGPIGRADPLALEAVRR